MTNIVMNIGTIKLIIKKLNLLVKLNFSEINNDNIFMKPKNIGA